ERDRRDKSAQAGQSKSVVKEYLTLVYREGMVERPGKATLDEQVGEQALREDFASLGVLSFQRRIRHFSDGVFLGGKDFCRQQFREFRSYFQTKKEREGLPLMSCRAAVPGGLLDIYSIRKLT
ncbi:hypothetical protein JXQ70_05015, partial [bacterium]|nr:hypothetical protein [bacterium]